MTSPKKEELEAKEAEHGLKPDGLTYQQRCSRIAAVEAGKEWRPQKPKPKRRMAIDMPVSKSAMFGKKVIITPLMVPDAKRNLAYDEDLGPEVTVSDVNAGERIYDKGEDVQNMVTDYHIDHIDTRKHTFAKTTFPKIGTEISYTIGRDLVPVVRGNDGKEGYIWVFPTSMVEVPEPNGKDVTVLQLYGLRSLIRQVYPELLPRFSGKPMMDYIDGITLAASIPQTHALLKEHRRRELMAGKAFGEDYGLV